MSSILKGVIKEAISNPNFNRQIKNIMAQHPAGSAAEKIVLNRFMSTPLGHDLNGQDWVEQLAVWLETKKEKLANEFPELDLSDVNSLAAKMYEDFLAKQGQLEENWKGKALSALGGAAVGGTIHDKAFQDTNVVPLVPDPLAFSLGGAYAGKKLYDKFGNQVQPDRLQVPPGVNPVDPNASRPGPYKQPDPFKPEVPSITDKPRVRVNPSTGSFEPVQTKTKSTKTRDPKTGRFAGKTPAPSVEPPQTLGQQILKPGHEPDIRTWRNVPGSQYADDLAKAATKTPIGRKIAAGLGALGTLGTLGYGLVTGTDAAKVKPEVKPASNAKPPERKPEEPAGFIAPDTQAELDAAAEVERNRNRDLEVDSAPPAPPTDILGAPGSDTAERITPLDGPTGGRPPVGASSEPDILGGPGADTSEPVDPIDRNRTRIRKPSEIYKQPEMTNETPADIVTPVKLGAKGLGKLGAKAIPFVGVPLAAADAAERYKNKDYVGAGLQGAATVAYAVPGPGQWVGGGLDALTIAKDIAKDMKKTPQTAIGRGIKEAGFNRLEEGEVVSMQARKTPLVVAGHPFNWNVYDLRNNKMVANILGGDRWDSKLYEIRIRSSGMTPETRMLPTYVLTAGAHDNPPYKAYELVAPEGGFGKIEKSPGPGGTTKLHPDQDDMLRHLFKNLGGGKYYGYDLMLVEEGLDQWELIEKALGAKIMEIDDAMELGYTDIDPEDSSGIIYLGNQQNEGYSAGAAGGVGLGEVSNFLALRQKDDEFKKIFGTTPLYKQGDKIVTKFSDRTPNVKGVVVDFDTKTKKTLIKADDGETYFVHAQNLEKLKEDGLSDEERYGKVGAEIRRLDPEAYKNRPRDYQGNIDLLNKLRAQSQNQELPAITPATEPRPSQRYPDSGLQPGQQFVDPRNNPGNLRGTDALRRPGYVLDKAVGFDKKGFAIFANPEDGKEAMRRQLQLDAVRRGLTGRQLINKYAPPSDNNDTDAYVKNVFGELGLDPDQKIDPQQLAAIQKLMVRQEHGKEGMQHYFPDVPTNNMMAQVNEMEILQRFLDKQIEKGAKAQAEKDKAQAASEKPVANPNARYARPGEPKSAAYDISQPAKPVDPMAVAIAALPKDIEDAKKLKAVPKESSIMQGLRKSK